jgi:hypothetical protein
MKTFSTLIWRSLNCLAIACLVCGATTGAHAVPQRQILVVRLTQQINEICCFSWGETVFANEPTKLSPVTVRWSTDFQLQLPPTGDTGFRVGLMVNGGSCLMARHPWLVFSATPRAISTEPRCTTDRSS